MLYNYSRKHSDTARNTKGQFYFPPKYLLKEIRLPTPTYFLKQMDLCLPIQMDLLMQKGLLMQKDLLLSYQ